MKLVSVVVVLCVAMFVSSCSMPADFMDPSFIYPDLQASGIAILPVGADMSTQADMSTRRDAAMGLEMGFADRLPHVKVLGLNTTGVSLSQEGLTETYSKMLQAFMVTGVIDADALRKLGDVFGTRYLLIAVIQGSGSKKGSMGTDYFVKLNVLVWDVVGAKTVFQNLVVGKSEAGILTSGSLGKAAAKAGEVSAKYFPKPPEMPSVEETAEEIGN